MTDPLEFLKAGAAWGDETSIVAINELRAIQKPAEDFLFYLRLMMPEDVELIATPKAAKELMKRLQAFEKSVLRVRKALLSPPLHAGCNSREETIPLAR